LYKFYLIPVNCAADFHRSPMTVICWLWCSQQSSRRGFIGENIEDESEESSDEELSYMSNKPSFLMNQQRPKSPSTSCFSTGLTFLKLLRTRSQAVARIADRTASQHLWGSRDVSGHVTIW